ncbi:hypothetical protein CTAYLR_007256 [Chrysophaeum taylorii]|uniref:Myosin motor domain-containing protein n=1 Tax=Chrysophaeum taylorii TaxID=2483200 RepID=A0AAD7UBP4_9STRA|nr:hypothetical protein CTAYLR_007256 [Chrysophaeum taylorii]
MAGAAQLKAGDTCWVPVASSEAVYEIGRVASVEGESKLRVEVGESVVTAAGDECFVVRDIARAQSVTADLAMLAEVNPATILHVLRARFGQDEIYTAMGTVLVALNPFKQIARLYDGATLETFARRALGKEEDEAMPHVWDVAARACRFALRAAKPQSLIISGESGAGKTETAKLVLQLLAGTSKLVVGESSHAITPEMILSASPILESFGNAKTLRNNNSSRFGKYTEIKVSEVGQILGAANTNYLLEKSRVVFQSAGERNYHCYYQTLAAFEEEELRRFVGETASRVCEPWWRKGDSDVCSTFSYLAISGCSKIPGKDDGDELREVASAVAKLKFSSEETAFVFGVVAAVLHLGNIEFEATQDEETCRIAEGRAGPAASALRVDPAILSLALVSRKIGSGRRRSFATKGLTATEASDGRDALAKAIHAKLFDVLVWRVNREMDHQHHHQTNDDDDGSATTTKTTPTPTPGAREIGILDVFGFEIFKCNSFEQLCINLANEHLQNKFNRDIFETEMLLYAEEGVSCADVRYDDNGDILKCVAGIFDALDEEGRLPRGSDKGWHGKLAKTYASHPRFTLDKRRRSDRFGIRHYAGEVAYEIRDFLEKNLDRLSADLQQCLDASDDPRFQNLLGFDQEAPDEAFLTQTKAAHTTTPKSPRKSHKTSASKKFRAQLASLMGTLDATDAHYVRCIKPNAEKVRDIFTSRLVLEQLRYSGVFETVAIQRSGWPFRYSFPDFAARYGHGLRLLLDLEHGDTRAFCRAAVRALRSDFGEEQLAVGKTRIFARSKAAAALEATREGARLAAVLIFQTRSRRALASSAARALKEASRRFDATHYDDLAGLVSTCRAATAALATAATFLPLDASKAAASRLGPRLKAARVAAAKLVAAEARAAAWVANRLGEARVREAGETADADRLETAAAAKGNIREILEAVVLTKGCMVSAARTGRRRWGFLAETVLSKNTAPSSQRLRRAIVAAKKALADAEAATRASELLERGTAFKSGVDIAEGLALLVNLRSRGVVDDAFCAEVEKRARDLKDALVAELETVVAPLEKKFLRVDVTTTSDELLADPRAFFDRARAPDTWCAEALLLHINNNKNGSSNNNYQSAEAIVYSTAAKRIAEAREASRCYDFRGARAAVLKLLEAEPRVAEKAPAAGDEVGLLLRLAADDEVRADLLEALGTEPLDVDNDETPACRKDASAVRAALVRADDRRDAATLPRRALDPTAYALERGARLVVSLRDALFAKDDEAAIEAIERLESYLAQPVVSPKPPDVIVEEVAAAKASLNFERFLRDADLGLPGEKKTAYSLSEDEWEAVEARMDRASRCVDATVRKYRGVERRLEAVFAMGSLRRALRDADWDRAINECKKAELVTDLRRTEISESTLLATDASLATRLCEIILIRPLPDESEEPGNRAPLPKDCLDLYAEHARFLEEEEHDDDEVKKKLTTSIATRRLLAAAISVSRIRCALGSDDRAALDVREEEEEEEEFADTRAWPYPPRYEEALAVARREKRIARAEGAEYDARRALHSWRRSGGRFSGDVGNLAAPPPRPKGEKAAALFLEAAREAAGLASRATARAIAAAETLETLRTKAAANAWRDPVFSGPPKDFEEFLDNEDRVEASLLRREACDVVVRTEAVAAILRSGGAFVDAGGAFRRGATDPIGPFELPPHPQSETTVALVRGASALSRCRAALEAPRDWTAISEETKNLRAVAAECRAAAAKNGQKSTATALEKVASQLVLLADRAEARHLALAACRAMGEGRATGRPGRLSIDGVHCEALRGAADEAAALATFAPYVGPVVAAARDLASLRERVVVLELTSVDDEAESAAALADLRTALGRASRAADVELQSSSGGDDWEDECPSSVRAACGDELDLLSAHERDASCIFEPPLALYGGYGGGGNASGSWSAPQSDEARLVVASCALVRSSRALRAAGAWRALREGLENDVPFRLERAFDVEKKSRIPSRRRNQLAAELRELRALASDRDACETARLALADSTSRISGVVGDLDLTRCDANPLLEVQGSCGDDSFLSPATKALVAACAVLAAARDALKRSKPDALCLEDLRNAARLAGNAGCPGAESELSLVRRSVAADRAIAFLGEAISRFRVRGEPGALDFSSTRSGPANVEPLDRALDAEAALEVSPPEARDLARAATAIRRCRAAAAAAHNKDDDDDDDDDVLAAVAAAKGVPLISAEVELIEADARRRRAARDLSAALLSGRLEGRVGNVRLEAREIDRLGRAAREASRWSPGALADLGNAVFACREAAARDDWLQVDRVLRDSPLPLEKEEEAVREELALFRAEADERAVLRAVERAIGASAAATNGETTECAAAACSEALALAETLNVQTLRLRRLLELVSVLETTRRAVAGRRDAPELDVAALRRRANKLANRAPPASHLYDQGLAELRGILSAAEARRAASTLRAAISALEPRVVEWNELRRRCERAAVPLRAALARPGGAALRIAAEAALALREAVASSAGGGGDDEDLKVEAAVDAAKSVFSVPLGPDGTVGDLIAPEVLAVEQVSCDRRVCRDLPAWLARAKRGGGSRWTRADVRRLKLACDRAATWASRRGGDSQRLVDFARSLAAAKDAADSGDWPALEAALGAAKSRLPALRDDDDDRLFSTNTPTNPIAPFALVERDNEARARRDFDRATLAAKAAATVSQRCQLALVAKQAKRDRIAQQRGRALERASKASAALAAAEAKLASVRLLTNNPA